MIVFAHTKFGLVRIKGSGVKRAGSICPPPLPSLTEFLRSQHGKFTLGSFSDRDEMHMIQCSGLRCAGSRCFLQYCLHFSALIIEE